MAIAVSAETQTLIESRMKELGFADSDEFLRTVVGQFDPDEKFYYEDLDDETRAAIEVGQKQVDDGLGIPWEEVKAQLQARFAKNKR